MGRIVRGVVVGLSAMMLLVACAAPSLNDADQQRLDQALEAGRKAEAAAKKAEMAAGRSEAAAKKAGMAADRAEAAATRAEDAAAQSMREAQKAEQVFETTIMK